MKTLLSLIFIFSSSFLFCQIHVDQINNVGIGTTTPTSKLQVENGSIKVVSDGTKFELFENDVNQNDGFLKLHNLTGYQNQFLPLLWFKNNSTVGNAGSTIISDSKSTNANNAPSLTISARTNNSPTSNILFQLRNYITPHFTVRHDGKVGIGANLISPTQQLDILGNLRVRGSIHDTNNSSGTSGQVLTSNGSGAFSWANPSGGNTSWGFLGNAINTNQFIGTTNNQPFDIKTNNILRLRIDQDGRLLPTFGASNTNTLSIGSSSGLYTSGALNCVFIGFESGKGDVNNLNIGGNNTFIGNNTGKANTSGTGNVFMGFKSGSSNTTGYDNNFFGASSGLYNLTGARNNYFGLGAGQGISLTEPNTGSNNNFFGYSSGGNNTSGSDNNFFGTLSGKYSTIGYQNNYFGPGAGQGISLAEPNTGNDNNFFGNQSGFYNTTGNHNVSIGYHTGRWSTSGNNNIYIGQQAGRGLSSTIVNTGSYNVYLGYFSALENSTGEKNVFLGFESGMSNTTGNTNVCIGNETNLGSSGLSNAMALGNNTTVSASNQIAVGDVNINWIGGQVVWDTYSDQNFKENIIENVPGINFIRELRPVTYTMNTRDIDLRKMINMPDSIIQRRINSTDYTNSSNVVRTGFLAQEVEATCNNLGFNFDAVHTPSSNADLYSLSYASFVVPLVKAVQEQQDQIELLSDRNRLLEQNLDEMKKLIQDLEKAIKK